MEIEKKPNLKKQSNSNMLCSCILFSYQDLESLLKANKGLTFDKLIEITGVGTKCTACLLDFELIFSKQKGSDDSPPSRIDRIKNYLESTRPSNNANQPTSLKQRIYQKIDRLTPMVNRARVDTTYYFPIISKHNVKQFLWVSNYSMLFEGVLCGPSMDIDVIVRNSSGTKVHCEIYKLEQESSLRIDVSKFLPFSQDGNLSIGSMSVYRIPKKIGIRGTTRPQTEVVGEAGASCVHGQAAHERLQGEITLICRPKDTRFFMGILNASNKTMLLEVRYPVPINEVSSGQLMILKLEPHGAILHEIKLTKLEEIEFFEKPFSVKWSSELSGKIYLYSGNLDLTTISIDHI